MSGSFHVASLSAVRSAPRSVVAAASTLPLAAGTRAGVPRKKWSWP